MPCRCCWRAATISPTRSTAPLPSPIRARSGEICPVMHSLMIRIKANACRRHRRPSTVHGVVVFQRRQTAALWSHDPLSGSMTRNSGHIDLSPHDRRDARGIPSTIHRIGRDSRLWIHAHAPRDRNYRSFLPPIFPAYWGADSGRRAIANSVGS